MPGIEEMKLKKSNDERRKKDMKVKELINDEDGRWKLDTVEELLSNVEKEAIQAVQLPREEKEDKRVWPKSKTGNYNVKTGYHCCVTKRGRTYSNRVSTS